MDADFLQQQQAAINRMREMNQKSAYYVKPKQNKVAETNNVATDKNKHPSEPPKPASFGGLNIPFLDTFLKEKDATLILGLLLILLNENSDRLLLLALVYILM